jgi:hypothetical protein
MEDELYIDLNKLTYDHFYEKGYNDGKESSEKKNNEEGFRAGVTVIKSNSEWNTNRLLYWFSQYYKKMDKFNSF